jgi:hypothetical protein
MKSKKKIRDHSPLKFTVMNGNFWRNSRGEKTNLGPQLMIAWSYDAEADRSIRGTLRKIGAPEFISRWMDEIARKVSLMPVNPFGYLGTLIFNADEVDRDRINEINKMIGIAGYVGHWLEREGIIAQVIERYKQQEQEHAV